VWFDAHLDLAYLDVNRRDMSVPLERLGDDSAGVHPPAAVTLPELREAGVRRCLGTIFTEPDGDGPEGYEAGDAESASHVGREQLAVYERWASDGTIDLAMRGEFADGDDDAMPSLTVGVLVGGADPVREPDELAWWAQRGVVAVGLTWAL